MMAYETDWGKLGSRTDEEIAQAASEDPDTFMTDEAFWQDAELVLPAKQLITARFDTDIIEFFKGDSPKGYQTRMNMALRIFMENAKKQQGLRPKTS